MCQWLRHVPSDPTQTPLRASTARSRRQTSRTTPKTTPCHTIAHSHTHAHTNTCTHTHTHATCTAAAEPSSLNANIARYRSNNGVSWSFNTADSSATLFNANGGAGSTDLCFIVDAVELSSCSFLKKKKNPKFKKKIQNHIYSWNEYTKCNAWQNTRLNKHITCHLFVFVIVVDSNWLDRWLVDTSRQPLSLGRWQTFSKSVNSLVNSMHQ